MDWMAPRYITFVVLVLSQQVDSNILPTARVPYAIPSRASVLRMDQAPEPFSTDFVHVFDANLGDDRQCQLALTRVSDSRRAKLALWRMICEHEAGSDATKFARAEAELRATLALSAGQSCRTFGAYLNVSSMNDGEEHAIVLLRIEGDMRANTVMIIDLLLVSPALPKEVRPALHSVVVESLRSMGKADDMSEDGFRHLPPPLGNAHNYPNSLSVHSTTSQRLDSLRSV